MQYIIPPAVIASLLYLGYINSSFIIGCFYVLNIIIHLALWPFRHRKRKKEEKEYLVHLDRLQKMVSVYYSCKPPVISPIILDSYLKKAQDSGAIFDGITYAILNRILERDKNVFIPFETSD